MRIRMPFSAKKWKRKHTILLLERLELYLAAGLALDRALKITVESSSKQEKDSLVSVCRSVEGGSSLSRALSDNIRIPETTRGLLEHGEASGELGGALGGARSLLEKEDELVKKCVSAAAYPALIGVFAAVLTAGLVRGVMPQIIPMLEGLRVELPLLTRIVMFLSDGLLRYGIFVIAAALFGAVIFSASYKKFAGFRKACQSFLLRLPIIGRLILSYALSIFMRSCGSLVAAGMPARRAYSSAAETMRFMPLRGVIAGGTERISRGVPIGTVMAGIKRLPPYIAPLIMAGEASGSLGNSLIRSADIVDRDLGHSLQRLTSLAEPLMMAVMGSVVGAIALSIMMPIYDVSKMLQR